MEEIHWDGHGRHTMGVVKWVKQHGGRAINVGGRTRTPPFAPTANWKPYDPPHIVVWSGDETLRVDGGDTIVCVDRGQFAVRHADL